MNNYWICCNDRAYRRIISKSDFYEIKKDLSNFPDWLPKMQYDSLRNVCLFKGKGYETIIKIGTIAVNDSEYGVLFFDKERFENLYILDSELKDSKIIIKLFKTSHNTCDAVLYNAPNKIIELFRGFDIWGSKGYDRFNDGGIYFEIPVELKPIIKDIPVINRNGVFIQEVN
jgi:hypothetical protein